MKREFLHSFSMPYQNAMALFACYNNNKIGNPLGDNKNVNNFFISKIAPLTKVYKTIEFEIEDHDLNSTQPTRGVTLNIFGVDKK